MPKEKKKLIRKLFRISCLERDGYKCAVCGYFPDDPSVLDVHHIKNRGDMPNGGYVCENGISLCPNCHVKAESGHATGIVSSGYSEHDLYSIIGSSYNKAVEASERLTRHYLL
jgi:hypothetical protein